MEVIKEDTYNTSTHNTYTIKKIKILKNVTECKMC